jgi:hypothetical protein
MSITFTQLVFLHDRYVTFAAWRKKDGGEKKIVPRQKRFHTHCG